MLVMQHTDRFDRFRIVGGGMQMHQTANTMRATDGGDQNITVRIEAGHGSGVLVRQQLLSRP
ncbi:hypothetical protein AA0228_2202 [Gluconobacter frateurii NRIC 0228]|uniref:Uncharacterized protein n=1 Tax=Gluconobacter frateurii NRIC 0228 TaxID=1307946 RepID=A0ABQ0QDD6_9PROT|nr:hypothetical protein AA0228_2202 [Gluconobacter frateurii NRIC 0228]